MFSKFKELFGSENLLDSAFNTTVTMLEFDQEMFLASRHSLRETDSAEVDIDIKGTDRKINKYQREVRRNVLTHLTVAGTQNLVPGLALLTIIIDVERIGDYTKNILALAVRHPNRLCGGAHEQALKEIEAGIEAHLPIVINSLQSQSKKEARTVMQDEELISKKSDNIVNSMIQSVDPPSSCPDAVALALYARYLKRINSHLTNVASAIVNPFYRIGFREKKKK